MRLVFSRRHAIVCSLALCVSLTGTPTAREVAGVTMPDSIRVAGQELHLNGMGLRKEKLFFKVDVVALYVQKPSSNAEAIIKADEPKEIALSMLRDISRDTFVEAVEHAIARNSSPELPALRSRLDTLEQALPPLKKGDMLDFAYLPGKGTLLRGEGREITIPGKDFADALFTVWLGPKPLNNELKHELLGG